MSERTPTQLLEDAAAAYAAKVKPAAKGTRDNTAFNLAGHLCSFITKPSGERLSEAQILSIVSDWNQRLVEPLAEQVIRQKVQSAFIGNGTPRKDHVVEPHRRKRAKPRPDAEQSSDAPAIVPTFITAADLMRQNPELRPPLIHGLLRVGEVGNIVGSPKIMHKTHTAIALGMAACTGGRWLDFRCEQSDVLYLDAELHPETFAHRLPRIGAALGLTPEQWQDRFTVDCLRGRLTDIYGLGPYIRSIEPGRFRLTIIDSLYRFWPADMNENDNAAITAVYNRLDEYAMHLDGAIVVIHHASKGYQSDKQVSDVGSGAGAQSRSADAHVVLRPHEDDDAVVLDGVVRSWPPVEPIALRWEYPIWKLAPDLDPSKLRQPGRRRKPKDDAPKVKVEPWTAERFVRSFIKGEPLDKKIIVQEARVAGVTNREAEAFIAGGLHDGSIHRWTFDGDRRVLLASRAQMLLETAKVSDSHTHTTPHTPRRRQTAATGRGSGRVRKRQKGKA